MKEKIIGGLIGMGITIVVMSLLSYCVSWLSYEQFSWFSYFNQLKMSINDLSKYSYDRELVFSNIMLVIMLGGLPIIIGLIAFQSTNEND